MMGMMGDEDEASETEPAREQAPPAGDKAAAARALVHTIDVALRVYKMEKGKFPDDLGALLVPNDDHQQGYLVGMKEIPNDPWGTKIFYKRSDDGATFQLRSFGPNAKDDGGAGDDIH
jgi:hypothetical protein